MSNKTPLSEVHQIIKMVDSIHIHHKHGYSLEWVDGMLTHWLTRMVVKMTHEADRKVILNHLTDDELKMIEKFVRRKYYVKGYSLLIHALVMLKVVPESVLTELQE